MVHDRGGPTSDAPIDCSEHELVADLSVQTDTAVIWVSHDLAIVRTIASRALVMREGQVCEQGSLDELFVAAQHPYTQELLAAIPELEAADAR